MSDDAVWSLSSHGALLLTSPTIAQKCSSLLTSPTIAQKCFSQVQWLDCLCCHDITVPQLPRQGSSQLPVFQSPRQGSFQLPLFPSHPDKAVFSCHCSPVTRQGSFQLPLFPSHPEKAVFSWLGLSGLYLVFTLWVFIFLPMKSTTCCKCHVAYVTLTNGYTNKQVWNVWMSCTECSIPKHC